MSTEIVTVDAIDFPVATYRNVRVVTTELLAQAFGATPVKIRQNHTNNRERFEDGKHFFKLAGEELQDFASRLNLLTNPSKIRSLILWTERGAARHAKMLETDQAWEVFEKLEDAYFHRKDKPTIARQDRLSAEAKTSYCLDDMEFRVTLSEWERATTVIRDSQATVERIRLVARISQEAMQGIRAVGYESNLALLPAKLQPLARVVLANYPTWRAIVRYKALGLNHAEIGTLVGRDRSTVRRHVRELEACGLLTPPRALPAMQQMTLQFDGGAA